MFNMISIPFMIYSNLNMKLSRYHYKYILFINFHIRAISSFIRRKRNISLTAK